jgi:site-specific DNA-cytosine methylase
MLRSADLFAGMGGWTLALQGAVEPVVYCDVDERVQAYLSREISVGSIPSAPMVADVRDLAALRAYAPVDVVTAGFPCVGFSSAGKKKGLDDERSGLFYDTVVAALAMQASHVLFENVPDVLKHARAVCDTLVSAGFESVLWTVVSAADVGAPHVRRRWFCLASKRGLRLRLDGLEPLPGWGGAAAPPPLRPGGHTDVETAELALLGNSLVPQAARAAVLHLSSMSYEPGVRTEGPELHGAFVDGEFRRIPAPRVAAATPVDVVLCPRHYDRGNAETRSRTPELQETRRAFWPTPRHGPCSHSHVLTERTSWDLATAARFAKSAGGVAFSRSTPRDRLNPEFVRYLMRGACQDTPCYSDIASADLGSATQFHTQFSPNSQPSANVQPGANRHCAPNVHPALNEQDAPKEHPAPKTHDSPNALL